MFDDLKYAWRRLRSAPVFALTAAATLALGIGANTAIFSIADAVLFRPLPYADPDALYVLMWRNPQTGARASFVESAYLQAIDDHHVGLSAVGLLEPDEALVDVTPAGAESVPISAVTPNYFDLLGANAARGRLLTAGDESAVGRAAVLTYTAWQTRFGGRDDVFGRPLTIGNVTLDIVGVLEPDFVFPSYARPASVITVMPPSARRALSGGISAVVRLTEGVTREQAQAELDVLVRPMVQAKPSRGYDLYLSDVRSLLYPTGRPIMMFLLAASGLVLLLGCANLVNLLLARARQQERELGIRLALGASRTRVVRELVWDAGLIAVAGAAVALLATYWSFDLLLPHVPPVAYGRAPVGVTARVFAFGLAISTIASLLIAAMPAWRATRADAQHLLQRRASAGRSRFGRPMVVAQVAMAVVLVFGATVTARALIAVLRVPLGFSSENVLRMSGARSGLRGVALQDYYMNVLERLSRRGDVIAAGGIASIPLGGSVADEPVTIGGVRQKAAGLFHVLPGYFETLQIPVRRGRLLDANDARTGAGVAIVSESAARVLFPDRDPLGATLSNGRGRSLVVVGIVADIKRSFDTDTMAPVYVLGGESTRGTMSIVVRVRARRDAVLGEMRRELGALAPGTPIGAGWWSDEVSSITAYRNPRFQTLVLGSFAGLALVLTATGILGVVSFLVATRTREMGIRMAVGATPSSLVGLMLRQTLTPIAVGLVAGIVATRWFGRLAEAQLFKVAVDDPAMLMAAAVTVLTTAAMAAYLPARRAGRVDPITILRVD